ncbi:hypothetical protein SDRG_17017 [Saprolegnia diclina VS20]|uniref:Uncharacterized protein n=1 Tax=Saprolegnia diclina (strain VS20) TaxID=1156394 RepID=T0QZC3_SAPDV|nr:hypothetical protein SDRG_17017 [Saprolegnia diclina VS20]EQC25103.1 hypothetical protein SDRG_17017 [Saprolegnia diclina VS20]|eukprot:XP_008621472.1 hypothetical protein SDRG_17017 [Saprolegnia diclina VS20]
MESRTIKAKYKAAIDQLVLERTFVSTYTQSYITDPFLRINGLSEYITWPLPTRQETQIASLYTSDVIPASAFRINNHVGWNAFLDDVLVSVRKDFGQEHATATLSHLCFDANGNSTALAPSAEVPNTLGVLIIWLPSTYVGGGLFFQSDHRSETVDEMPVAKATLQCLATYSSTQLVSTRIMIGRRVALVYNLVCTKPESGFRTAPQAQEVAVAALLDIANEPLHRQPLVFRYITKPSGRSFGELPLAGAERVLPLSRSVVLAEFTARAQRPLEIDSTREFLLGAMSMFTTLGASRLPFEMDAVASMGSLLLAYNECDLVRLFVGHVVSVTPTTPIDSIAPLLRACVVQYGWVRLRPAILSLIDRWVPSHTGEVLQLLASLVGITHDAVCPPLRHEDVAALVATSWRQVLAHERLFANDRDPVPTFIAHYLLLQWHMTLPGASEGSCLAHKLPTVLVQLVESFVSPKSTDVLVQLQAPFFGIYSIDDGRSDDEEGDATSYIAVDTIRFSIALVMTLPQALAAVLRSQPNMPLDAYAEALVAAVDTVSTHEISRRIKTMSLPSIGCIVTSLDATGRCSAAVLAHMWEIWRFSVVAALDALLKRRPMPLSPATTFLFGDFLVALAPQLPLVEGWALRHLEHKRDFPSITVNQHRAGIFPAALRILLAVAPDHIEAFAASWLRAVPSTIEANRLLLLPAISALAEKKLVRVTALVAAKCLATFDAVGVREPLPDVADFSLPDIFVNDAHCSVCAHFRDFLWDRCQDNLYLSKETGQCHNGDVTSRDALVEALRVKHKREKDREIVLWLDILVAQAPVHPYDPAHLPRKRQRTLEGTIHG